LVISHRSFPRLVRAKPILLVAALALAGCGGGSSGWQGVSGDGFRFSAPPGWTVTQSGGGADAADGNVDRVQVQLFHLVQPYRSTLFAAAAHELDRRIAQLALLQKGRVQSRATVRVDRMDARTYRIAYGPLVEEITFVLDGRREYELLCRRHSTAADETCRRFLASFRLG
jgi:hypothetical protein